MRRIDFTGLEENIKRVEIDEITKTKDQATNTSPQKRSPRILEEIVIDTSQSEPFRELPKNKYPEGNYIDPLENQNEMLEKVKSTYIGTKVFVNTLIENIKDTLIPKEPVNTSVFTDKDINIAKAKLRLEALIEERRKRRNTEAILNNTTLEEKVIELNDLKKSIRIDIAKLEEQKRIIDQEVTPTLKSIFLETVKLKTTFIKLSKELSNLWNALPWKTLGKVVVFSMSVILILRYLPVTKIINSLKLIFFGKKAFISTNILPIK
jgi:hypothetical protein